MSRKKIENSLLAVLGIGLIVTSVMLLLRKNRATIQFQPTDDDGSFLPSDYNDHGLHVFSESGILL